MNATKNYSTDGGDRWVVGGTLEILPEAMVTGLGGRLTPAAFQADAVTTDVSVLVMNFNALLSKLKEAGLMASE